MDGSSRPKARIGACSSSRLCWPSSPRPGCCLGGQEGVVEPLASSRAANPDEYYAEANDLEVASSKGTGYYSIVAVVAGVSFLVGGLYAYNHSSHPAPTGYTWIAWSGPPIVGDIAIGSNGKKLTFQIVHHQSDTTTFKLSAAWLGSTFKVPGETPIPSASVRTRPFKAPCSSRRYPTGVRTASS